MWIGLIEYSRIKVPSLSSGCEIAPFFVRYMASRIPNRVLTLLKMCFENPDFFFCQSLQNLCLGGIKFYRHIGMLSSSCEFDRHIGMLSSSCEFDRHIGQLSSSCEFERHAGILRVRPTHRHAIHHLVNSSTVWRTKICAISHPLLNEGTCIREYSIRLLSNIHWNDLKEMYSIGLKFEYSRITFLR